MRWNEIISEDEQLPKLVSDVEAKQLADAGYERVAATAQMSTYQKNKDPKTTITVGNNGIQTPNRIGRISRGRHSSLEQAIRFNNGEEVHQASWKPFHGEPMRDTVDEAALSEGADYDCPNCGEYLGKASEVIANNNECCGNCGWNNRKPEPKPLPKSKQSTEKVSGDYKINIHPGKQTADLYYEGPSVSIIRKGNGAGSATKVGDGKFVASWKIDFYNSNKIPGEFPTLTQAINAVKRMHGAKVKQYMKSAKKHGFKIGEMIDEDTSALFMNVATIPNWSTEDEQYSLVFSNPAGQEVKVHRDNEAVWAEVDNSWDKSFADEATAANWLKAEGFVTFVGVDDE